jgi:hypothetical protein
MSKLLPGLAIGLSLVAFPLAAVIMPAFAQEQTATVTIGDDYALLLSTATGIPVGDLPETIVVPVELASSVCGTTVAAGETCAASADVDSLAGYITSSSSSSSSSEESSSSSSESSEEPSGNSAKAYAPGQLKGDDESAKAYAPGQTKEDGESARDQAPGHQKGDKGKK